MIKIYSDAKLAIDEVLSRSTAAPDVYKTVGDIIADVRARGDKALFEYTKKFDGAELECIEVTDAEMLNRGGTELTFFEKVFPRLFSALGKKSLVEEACRLGGNRHDPLSPHFVSRTELVLLHGNPRTLSQQLHGFGVIQSLRLHGEGEDVAPRAATEAVKTSCSREDRKRRRLFVVERAKARKIAPRTFKLNVTADKLNYGISVLDFFKEPSGKRHRLTSRFKT